MPDPDADTTTADLVADPVFCPFPWMHLDINPQGTVKVCCRGSGCVKSADGNEMSIYHHSMDDIWNSTHMRDIRSRILAGKRVADCVNCYRQEKETGSSYRIHSIRQWDAGELRTRIAQSIGDGHHVAGSPSYYQINSGNLCNVKCRMCSSTFSSLIEEDDVHNKWAPHRYLGAQRLWKDNRAVLSPRVAGVRIEGDISCPSTDRVVVSGSGTMTVAMPGTVALCQLSLEIITVLRAVRIFINDAQVLARRRPGVAAVDLTMLPDAPWLSVRIEGDCDIRNIVVERQIDHTVPALASKQEGRVFGSRFKNEEPWHRQADFVFGELLGAPEDIRSLYFTGGEPFIIPNVEQMIGHLLDHGVADRVRLKFNTNCTIVRAPMLEKLAQFQEVNIALSLDSYGPYHEYMRFPGKWKSIDRNIRKLAALPNVNLFAVPIVQIYNVLYLPELFDYISQFDITFTAHYLSIPTFLQISLLPRSVLDGAVDRIQQFIDQSPRTRGPLQGVVKRLRDMKSRYTPERFSEFLEFTWDLDASRGQCFRDTFKELASLLVEAGVDLTEQHRYFESA